MRIQIFGSFIASAFAYWIYLPDFEDRSPFESICSLATCPGESTPGLMIVEQAAGLFLIVLTAFSTSDPENACPPGLAPFMIGLSAAMAGLTFSANSGYNSYRISQAPSCPNLSDFSKFYGLLYFDELGHLGNSES